jgi:DNA polymerase-3 subunit gamma/tau
MFAPPSFAPAPTAPAPFPVRAAPPVPTAAPEPRPVALALSSPPDLAAWRAVLGIVRGKRPALASVLEHAALLRFDAERVELGYEVGSFLVGQASEPAAQDLVRWALGAHFGRAPDFGIQTISGKSGAITLAMIETAERKTKLDLARKAVAEHPLVAAAIELLGAELRDVRLAEAET